MPPKRTKVKNVLSFNSNANVLWWPFWTWSCGNGLQILLEPLLNYWDLDSLFCGYAKGIAKGSVPLLAKESPLDTFFVDMVLFCFVDSFCLVLSQVSLCSPDCPEICCVYHKLVSTLCFFCLSLLSICIPMYLTTVSWQHCWVALSLCSCHSHYPL